MATKPEAIARQQIDAALEAAGWIVQDAKRATLGAARGVALREFTLKRSHGFADYLLYVDRKAVGAVEAKKVGATLTGVEIQSAKYGDGFPDGLQAWVRPLPLLYESTGVETRFTNRLDPDPRSREVFHFHRPETPAEWARSATGGAATVTTNGKRAGEAPAPYIVPTSLRGRRQAMPPIVETGLWPAQIEAVRDLEVSLRDDRPRSLIQMATGSGKTVTAISAIYRLIKFGRAQP
jgi:type I restriction enzyme R subunit